MGEAGSQSRKLDLAAAADFVLGGLRVHPSRCSVEDGNGEGRVEPKVMEALVVLCDAKGATVTRERLVEECWDGKIVSDDAIARIVAKVRRIAEGTDGRVHFKLETLPKIGYRLTTGMGTHRDKRHGARVEKCSIAVLPFANMSEDPTQDYFSDGISEDIITDLSRISGLKVISRNSSFTYKGRAVDIRTVGRDLGVTAVLEGSVRRAGNRIRITAQLIDATTGGHLWAERFDRDLSDLFVVQDDVTGRIVEALKVTLTPLERARLAGNGTRNIDAYDSFLRGWQLLLFGFLNRETFEKAIAFFAKAIELDSNYAKAHAGLAFTYLFDHQNRWSRDSQNSLCRAKENANRAIEKGPEEPIARVFAARVATFEMDFERAKAEADTALALSPNLSEAYVCLGEIAMFSGRPLEAIALIEQAMLFDPAYTQHYLHLLGVANILAGRCETAATLLRQRILLVPKTDFSRAALVSALGHLGSKDEAQRTWRDLKGINPRYSFHAHFGRLPFRNEQDVERIADGFAKAGIAIKPAIS
jgi:adenylate cyclase